VVAFDRDRIEGGEHIQLRLQLNKRGRQLAAADARQALKDDPAKLRQIEDGAKNFGLGG